MTKLLFTAFAFCLCSLGEQPSDLQDPADRIGAKIEFVYGEMTFGLNGVSYESTHPYYPIPTDGNMERWEKLTEEE